MNRILVSLALLCCLVSGCGSPLEVAYNLPNSRHLTLTLPSGWQSQGEDSWGADHRRVSLELQQEDPRQRLVVTVQEAIRALEKGDVEGAVAAIHANPKPVWPPLAEDYDEVAKAWVQVKNAQGLYQGLNPVQSAKQTPKALSLLRAAASVLSKEVSNSLPARASRFLAFRNYHSQIGWTPQGVEPRTVQGQQGVLATTREQGREGDVDQFLMLEPSTGTMLVVGFWNVGDKPELVDSVLGSLQLKPGPAPRAPRGDQEPKAPPLGEEAKVALFALICMSLPAAFGAAIGHSGVRVPDGRSWGPAASGAFFTTAIATALGTVIAASLSFGGMKSSGAQYHSGNPLVGVVLLLTIGFLLAACAGITAAAAFGAAAGAGAGARLGRFTATLGAAIGAPAVPLLLAVALRALETHL